MTRIIAKRSRNAWALVIWVKAYQCLLSGSYLSHAFYLYAVRGLRLNLITKMQQKNTSKGSIAKSIIGSLIGILLVKFIFWKPVERYKPPYKAPPPLYLGKRGEFNIDSVIGFVKKDTLLNIDITEFDKKDSCLFLIAEPKFDYKNDTILNARINRINANYNIRYSTNISAITIIRQPSKRLTKSDSIENYVMWFYCKPGSNAEKNLTTPN